MSHNLCHITYVTLHNDNTHQTVFLYFLTMSEKKIIFSWYIVQSGFSFTTSQNSAIKGDPCCVRIDGFPGDVEKHISISDLYLIQIYLQSKPNML